MTENFSLVELTLSQYAVRNNIDNAPNVEVLKNLKTLATGLEQVRALLNAPIIISSAYRCLKLNRAIGSIDTSHHVLGYAADFICPKFGTPKNIVMAIKRSELKFDQLIFENTWVHISFAPALRGMVLSAKFNGGKTTYVPFKC